MVSFDVHRISLFCFHQFMGLNCLYHDKISTFSENFSEIFSYYLLFPMHNRFSQNTYYSLEDKIFRELLRHDKTVLRLNLIVRSAVYWRCAVLAECMRLHHCFVCVRLYPLLCYLKVWHTQPWSPNYEKRFKLAYLFKVLWKQLRIPRETLETYMRTYIIFDSTSGANFPYWI